MRTVANIFVEFSTGERRSRLKNKYMANLMASLKIIKISAWNRSESAFNEANAARLSCARSPHINVKFN